MLSTEKYSFDKVFRIFVVILFAAGGLWLLNYLSSVLLPFGVAFLITYLLNPLVCLIQKKVKNRVVAVFITLSGVAFVFVTVCYFVLKAIVNEGKHLVDIVTKMATEKELMTKAKDLIPKDLLDNINKMGWEEYRSFLDNEQWLAVFQKVMQALGFQLELFAKAGSLVFSLFGLSVVVLYVVFMLIDYDFLRKNWKKLLPNKHKSSVDGFLFEFDKVMNTHFRAQAVMSVIVGVLFSMGFGIIGLPLGILLGMMLGAMNMVPYLQIIGLIPAATLALIMAVETDCTVFSALMQTLGVFVVVQIIQDAVLVPKITGKSSGLRPVIILLATMIWGQLLGLLGLIIAIPMTCLLHTWYKKALAKENSVEEKESC